MTVRAARLAALAMMHEHGEAHPATAVDPWRLVSRRFSADGLGEAEALFALANGYMGIRGTHDAGSPSHDPAYFVTGFHETWPIPCGEAGRLLNGEPLSLISDDERVTVSRDAPATLPVPGDGRGTSAAGVSVSTDAPATLPVPGDARRPSRAGAAGADR